MGKEKQELLLIDSSEYNRIVFEKESLWTALIFRYFKLPKDVIDIAFSNNLRKWQELADMHKISVLKLPNGTTEISKNGEKYTWSVSVAKQKVPMKNKKYAFLIWTEPNTEI